MCRLTRYLGSSQLLVKKDAIAHASHVASGVQAAQKLDSPKVRMNPFILILDIWVTPLSKH